MNHVSHAVVIVVPRDMIRHLEDACIGVSHGHAKGHASYELDIVEAIADGHHAGRINAVPGAPVRHHGPFVRLLIEDFHQVHRLVAECGVRHRFPVPDTSRLSEGRLNRLQWTGEGYPRRDCGNAKLAAPPPSPCAMGPGPGWAWAILGLGVALS